MNNWAKRNKQFVAGLVVGAVGVIVILVVLGWSYVMPAGAKPQQRALVTTQQDEVGTSQPIITATASVDISSTPTPVPTNTSIPATPTSPPVLVANTPLPPTDTPIPPTSPFFSPLATPTPVPNVFPPNPHPLPYPALPGPNKWGVMWLPDAPGQHKGAPDITAQRGTTVTTPYNLFFGGDLVVARSVFTYLEVSAMDPGVEVTDWGLPSFDDWIWYNPGKLSIYVHPDMATGWHTVLITGRMRWEEPDNHPTVDDFVGYFTLYVQ